MTTRYLHDGDDLVMELDAAGNPVREYTYYPGTDRPHSVKRSSDGAIFYYVTERPGHVTALVDASNQVVNTYEYTPFGKVVSATEQVPQPLRFTAREYDSETELYYYRARYYDPDITRFISEDPIGLAGGINPFAYVGNDPINRRDPTGLTCWGMYEVLYRTRNGVRREISRRLLYQVAEKVVMGDGACGARWLFCRNFNGERARCVVKTGDRMCSSVMC
ncbi:MAG: RHS repeat-associated core domain-containing protein [Gemmatimonadaceae bacterium]